MKASFQGGGALSVILGLDPGSRCTGFGIVRREADQISHVGHGVIKLPTGECFSERLKILGQALRQVIDKYQPQVIVVEKVFFGVNADSAFKLGQARGVCLYEAALHKAQIYEYAAKVIKKGIVGNGSANKEQVQAVLKAWFNLKAIDFLDASDALALACYHGTQSEIMARLEGADL